MQSSKQYQNTQSSKQYQLEFIEFDEAQFNNNSIAD